MNTLTGIYLILGGEAFICNNIVMFLFVALLCVVEGYDGGSSDSECESPTLDEQERQSPLMPDFWLIVKIYQDRVKVYSHSRSGHAHHSPFFLL